MDVAVADVHCWYSMSCGSGMAKVGPGSYCLFVVLLGGSWGVVSGVTGKVTTDNSTYDYA